MKVGIDAISFYVPSLYLPIETLAEKRNIEKEKLQKGLGLYKMAINDTDEDTATLAANALQKLFDDFAIHPSDISRITMGTESALDSSKPTLSLATQMIEEKHGKRLFKNCDIIENTFACIGGIDALETTLDFIRLNPSKKAIVICSDYAKYELNSTGEYTQGSGAIAMLITAEPRLLSLDPSIGIGYKSEFDFFKPRRTTTDEQVLKALKTENREVEIFSDEPIFDGQFSNHCYQKRILEAYADLKIKKGKTSSLFEDWKYIFFHLPYAFHGKRIFSEIYTAESENALSTVEVESIDYSNDKLKMIAKSDEYRSLVQQKIEPTQRASSEIGNMYSCSIFMALLSGMAISSINNESITNQKVGLIAYGSGSKAKVLEGTIEDGWKEIIEKINLFDQLNNRISLDYKQYEDLHKKAIAKPIDSNSKRFRLTHIEKENPTLIGARTYKFN